MTACDARMRNSRALNCLASRTISRRISYQIVCAVLSSPRPWHVGHGAHSTCASDSRVRLRVISTRPSCVKPLTVSRVRSRSSARLSSATLTPEQIILNESSKPGVRALKAYLEYARSGRLEQGVTGLGGHDSPFEAEVSEVIEGLGYEVEPQVGVAGYRIDLAVRSRTSRDHFVVGIECDGATYHSAKSARDRDRLRQEILERLGWNLYRIWSTDWFLNREREVGRLKRHLDEVMAAH